MNHASVALTDEERECLNSLPPHGKRPIIARKSWVAERLANRGLAVPHPVKWLNYPLFTLSRKGEQARSPQ
jgi:hypothetical protein